MVERQYLTDNPGTKGRIRDSLEDFEVEEILGFEPTGEGEHLLILIEKRGISTYDAIRNLSRRMKISPMRFGFAGLKDARAVARQYLSLWDLKGIEIPDVDGVKVLKVWKHRKKLKPGCLKANKFIIIIRDPEHEEVKPILEELQKKGVPNFFGSQRFGSRRPNTHLVGKEIIKGDIEKALQSFVGNPYPTESEQLQLARGLFDKGELKSAISEFPDKFHYERSVVQALIEGKSKFDAFMVIPRRLRQLFVHAYQSWLFNRVLGIRLGKLKPMEGDILNRKGMPTGPIYGYEVSLAGGKPGEIEKEVLEKEEIKLEDFKCPVLPELASKGLRRPLTFELLDCGVSHDPLTLKFTIPKGCYATTVLREVMKTEVA